VTVRSGPDTPAIAKPATFIHAGPTGTALPVGYLLPVRECDEPEGRVLVALTHDEARDLEQAGRLSGPISLVS
jgi:hypothetical protein